VRLFGFFADSALGGTTIDKFVSTQNMPAGGVGRFEGDRDNSRRAMDVVADTKAKSRTNGFS
jgi:hypothetical protein